MEVVMKGVLLKIYKFARKVFSINGQSSKSEKNDYGITQDSRYSI